MSVTPKIPVKTALLSVSDKTGLVELATALAGQGIHLIASGGTATALQKAGLAVKSIEDVTHFPEILDGRVKTLHPKIHGGILARRGDSLHQQALSKHHIEAIDMVVVNLYPFAQTVASGASWSVCVENIDIGGVALIRAAAKNYDDVVILTNPSQYQGIIAELAKNKGKTTHPTREALATAAFQHTAAYEAMVANAFSQHQGIVLPQDIVVAGHKVADMRYGENPHQIGAFYRTSEQRAGVASATLIQGKPLSYNNVNDTDAAFELVAEFPEPAVAIVKHANPCGVGMATNLHDAYTKAYQADPTSAFGGIVAVNRELDKKTAVDLTTLFLEVVIAPSISHEAQVVLASKKNLRVLITGAMPNPKAEGLVVKSVAGGLLVQTRDNQLAAADDFRIVTKRHPSQKELADLMFANIVCKHVKSNAIVYAKDFATVGIGAGQMSRVDAARIAAQKAHDIASQAGHSAMPTQGSVVASDAFFPFADGLLCAIEAGVTAVIQPGGSKRDDEVIAAADAHNLAMIFTDKRHFKH